MLLYALLNLSGYAKISLAQVKTFRELGSHCAGHPEYDPSAGIETTTGPLGQGIANALGMAIAEAHLRATFGADLIDHMTYAFVGDGCLQEGLGQEVVSLAGHLRLGHLVFLWDDNSITDDGATSLSISENVAERFRVAGWHVVEIDGHDIEAIDDALAEAKRDHRPSLIACKTRIARGLARLEGKRGGHSGKLFPADRAAMAEAFDWPASTFATPGDIASAWQAAGRRSCNEWEEWRGRSAPAAGVRQAELARRMEGRLPDGWNRPIRDYLDERLEAQDAKPSIETSGDVAARLYAMLPELVVGCADLEAPTNHKRDLAAFDADDNTGRYIHCGVREHAMGSLANGIAAHGGATPLAVTYLAFSDYERPAMRMAALMGLPVKFVFSHDSIGIGKNGPTHQPVEILASLRAMPNMLVLRPADAVEMAECWEIMLSHATGPTSLVCARQALPTLRRTGMANNLCRRGAYVLADAEGPRQVTLIATGSEVGIALDARAALQVIGVRAAVVSMPSWELFETQDTAYREAVLDPAALRVGIEAAMRFGWDRWIRSDGIFVGMRGFGASGPADVLYRHFGITADAVVAAVRDRLMSNSKNAN
jgi:transketolase